MIDWNAIETVLLDMDGTLLDLHYDNYFWQEHLPRVYSSVKRVDARASSQHLKAHSDADIGTLQWYCLDHWSAKLGLDIASLKRELGHMIKIRPHAEEFLRQLQQSHCEVVMVTNAHPTTLEIKMEQIDIRRWFDRIVVSHDVGLPKEDPEFWVRLQARCPFDPQKTLLIDDTESVLASADQYGITHLLTLLQPDSRQQKRLETQFPGIHHFDEIMPTAYTG